MFHSSYHRTSLVEVIESKGNLKASMIFEGYDSAFTRMFLNSIIAQIVTLGPMPDAEWRIWIYIGDQHYPTVDLPYYCNTHLAARIDGPGIQRPVRFTYIKGSLDMGNREALEGALKLKDRGVTLNDLIFQQLTKTPEFAFRWEMESEFISCIENVRIWYYGQPETQWGFDQNGNLLKFENATLPEPEIQYKFADHILGAPQIDLDPSWEHLSPDEVAIKLSELAASSGKPRRRRR